MFSIRDWISNSFKVSETKFSDDVLLTEVSNYMDWSEEETIKTAAEQVNENYTYDDWFRTKKLTPNIRHELRKAYQILTEKSS